MYTPEVIKKFNDLAETYEFQSGVIDAKELVKDLKFSFTFDELGETFLSEINKSKRAKNGQFFTPKFVVDYLIEVSNYSSAQSMADISCGSGRFLIKALDLLIQKNISLEEIKERINGFDIDPILIRISLANIRGLLAKNGYQVSINDDFNVRVKDSLLDANTMFDTTSQFDVILGNPPYIKASPKTNLGHPNLYASFLEVGINQLKNDGRLGFIIPKSFISGAYFSKIRNALKNDVTIEELITLVERNTSFNDVLQEQVLLTLQKSKPLDKPIIVGTAITNGSFSIHKFEAPRSIIFWKDNYIAIPETESDMTLIKKCFQNGFSNVQKAGVRISTGPIVPFRTKDLLKNELADDSIPLYWPHHISAYKFDKLNNKKPEVAIKKDPSIEKYKLNKPVIAIKRISSKEQNKRIEAAIIEENGEYTLENHLNYAIRENEDAPSLRALEILFNSRLWDYLFRLINGNTQVSATEIRMFPIPHGIGELEVELDLQNESQQREIESKIHLLYGLTDIESSMVFNALK